MRPVPQLQMAPCKAQWNEVRTHLIGSYNIYNMLAAACIGLYFDVTEEQICHALANYVPTNNRSELEVTASNELIIERIQRQPDKHGGRTEELQRD